MALIQTTVDDEIKRKADEAFARDGITTPMAVRMMVTQVARTGHTPFEGVFTGARMQDLTEDVRRDMVYAEAQGLGRIPDDVKDAAYISDEVLTELGIDSHEVEQ